MQFAGTNVIWVTLCTNKGLLWPGPWNRTARESSKDLLDDGHGIFLDRAHKENASSARICNPPALILQFAHYQQSKLANLMLAS